MFPKMDVREITEARIGERSKKWMRKIYVSEQGVFARRLGDFDFRQTGERREHWRGLFIGHDEQRSLAARQPVVRRRDFFGREAARNYGKRGLVQQFRRKCLLNRWRDD